MTERKESDNPGETFGVNPDGADLDGTAEIERQKAEQGNRTDPTKPGDSSVPNADEADRPGTMR